jgi:hypothetical protein
MKICYKWGNCNVLYKNANWKFSECQLVDEIIIGNVPGVPGEFAQPSWLQDEPKSELDRKKRKRFIRLIYKVKNYPKYDESKEVKEDIKITVNDIKLVLKAVKGIDVEINE